MPESPDHHGHIVDGSRPAPASVDVDLVDAVVQGVRVGFGVLSLGLGVALRTLGESPPAVPRQAGPRIPVSDVADLLVGTAWGAARLSGRMAATGARIAAPVMGLALRPPLVPRRLQPAYGMQLMTARWQRDRPETLRTLGRLSAAAFPGAVDAALDHVDVDQVATVVLDRVDLTGIVAIVLERLDINQVASRLLDRLDVNQVADRLLNQIDLTQLVLDRVDLQRVVAGALDGLDLTAIVVDQVDLGTVVGAALEKVDLTAIVMQQVDLVGVAEYVVDAIDLPEIIRDSSGSVASEAVVGMRMQGIDADAAVGRVVDRILGRRRQQRTEAPGQLDSPSGPADPPTGSSA